MLYFIKIENDIINGSFSCDEEDFNKFELEDCYKQVSRKVFDSIMLPSTFEVNEKGEIINVQCTRKENNELITIINDLKHKITKLENRISKKEEALVANSVL
ncbi:hypothetical protein [Abyssisolibacter fermentans]|uniref:hypothetical protein n=1 Tax=Abyssisolibacter fermentans TaxID=1766203 RepID=UPI00082A5994|nr:hypothetical protein [Abyssisolibacter fermentans]